MTPAGDDSRKRSFSAPFVAETEKRILLLSFDGGTGNIHGQISLVLFAVELVPFFAMNIAGPVWRSIRGSLHGTSGLASYAFMIGISISVDEHEGRRH